MRPGLGVGIMILKEEKILLGLRNPNKEKASSELNGQGTWTMPGGKVEYMEKLIDAAKRELEEETSLVANDIKLICISDDMTDTAHYVTAGFLVNEYSGENEENGGRTGKVCRSAAEDDCGLHDCGSVRDDSADRCQ